MIDGVRLPIDWASYGLPAALRVDSVTLWQGSRAWHWAGASPALSIRAAGPPPAAEGAAGWGID
ncbi:MAG: hypothetical protein R3290_12975, partial [Acidimicrobiia bacterium]|nr:hypothetical protein [Acidimicrobiia bacterium]